MSILSWGNALNCGQEYNGCFSVLHTGQLVLDSEVASAAKL